MVLAFDSVSLTLTFGNIGACAVILSILGESYLVSTSLRSLTLASLDASAGHFSSSDTAPLAVGDLNQLVQQYLIVFVHKRIPLLIHEIVCALLFSPDALLSLNNLFSLGSIDHSGAVSLNALASRSVSLLNHV
jgi:hypothetical protein